jgi:uncharacterized protein YggT (Ycf19 family)
MPKLLSLAIHVVTTVVEGFLSLRIILKLFGASTSAPFVRWIYETSEPLLTPFIGMFPSPKLTGGFVIEFSALFALTFYAFISYLAIEILDTLIYYTHERHDKHSRR